MKRVDGYSIHNDLKRANHELSNEIGAVGTDIYICLDGNKSIFVPDEITKGALNHLYQLLKRYKEEERF